MSASNFLLLYLMLMFRVHHISKEQVVWKKKWLYMLFTVGYWPTTSRSPQKLLKKNKKFHKEKRCLLECNGAYINTEHKSADVNDGPLSAVAAADKQPDVCQESSNSLALHDHYLQQQQQQLQPSMNYDESANTTYCNQLTQSDTSSDYALPPDDDDDVVDGVDGLGDYHNRDDNDDETGMRDGSSGCGKDGSKRNCKRSSCNKIISGSMGIGYNDDDVNDDEEKEMNTYDDGVDSHMESPKKFSVRNNHGDNKNDDIYNNNYDSDDNDDDSSLQPTKCGYMFLIASHYPTTDNNNNNDGNDGNDEVSRILWRRCWCVCGGVQQVAADAAASTFAAANNDDDVASFFYIFKSKHAATPLKRVNMRSCLCVTREENVVIVSLARNNQDEPSTGDHHILKLACTSNQLATEWCLALNKKRCEFELTEKHLDQVASWVTLTTIDGTSTCWSVLKDNSMVLFEQPLSEAPLGKIQLSHYHVEESSMAIYSHHPLHHHRKSNEFSSGR
ncbi:hypothetical protein HELRODRAFT_187964, partial [Helobdella robusta]|uniref:PH domain-containing protein n=1 Tax=Helobdella robusta TaxID=6412 RepID=T1FPI5_HELRO